MCVYNMYVLSVNAQKHTRLIKVEPHSKIFRDARTTKDSLTLDKSTNQVDVLRNTLWYFNEENKTIEKKNPSFVYQTVDITVKLRLLIR